MKTVSTKKTSMSRRRIRGQGMTEYIIIVALIAIAAIAAVSFFGKTVQGAFAGLAASLTGDATLVTTARTTTEQAATDTDAAVQSKTLKTYNQ